MTGGVLIADALENGAPPGNPILAFLEEGLSQPLLHLNIHNLECSTGIPTSVRPRNKMPDGNNPEPWFLTGWQQATNPCQLSGTKYCAEVTSCFCIWYCTREEEAWDGQLLIRQEMLEQGNETYASVHLLRGLGPLSFSL